MSLLTNVDSTPRSTPKDFKDSEKGFYDRFRKSLGKWTYSSTQKNDGVSMRPTPNALEHPYIRFNNKQFINYLVFDIDHNGALEAANWAGVPEPNAIVLNRFELVGWEKHGRGHLIYELKNPVYIGENARLKPIEWLRNIERALTEKLGADAAFSGFLCKNPFSDQFHTMVNESIAPYTLEELGDFYISTKNSQSKLREDFAEGGRNNFLFEHCRFTAYHSVESYRHKGDRIGFDSYVLKAVESLNKNHFTQHTTRTGGFVGPLNSKEVSQIARSIASYTWDRYFPGKKTSIPRGVCNLFLDPTLTIKERQQFGQAYSANKKRKRTTELITQAIETLSASNIKITQSEVSKLSKRSVRTIKRYWAEVTRVLKQTSGIKALFRTAFNARLDNKSHPIEGDIRCSSVSVPFSSNLPRYNLGVLFNDSG